MSHDAETVHRPPCLPRFRPLPFLRLLPACHGSNGWWHQATLKVACGTEAGLFARAGVPSIVCGPGDIQQAHRANEYVELSQLTACEAFLCKVIHSMSVGAHP
jgi:acetylornithine deacetylase/succinyl-diaminopimelate desuccinylase-like protein